MPRSLLSPLAAGESKDDRKNVKLDSNYGGVDVSINLLGDAQASGVDEARLIKRTSLDVKAERGSINLKLVRPFFSIIFHGVRSYQLSNSAPVRPHPQLQCHSIST